MMNAVIKTKGAPGYMEYASVPIPSINPDQVLVEIKYCGICGTDHSLYYWNEAIAGFYKFNFPTIFGHEFSGVVSQIGEQVKGINVGDRVTVNPIVECGQCSYCAQGYVNICDDRKFLGIDYNGGFAQFIPVKAQSIIRLSDNVSFKAGAVIEPLCVAIHAIERVRPEFGDSALIMGPGAIGLLMVLILKSLGISPIIVSGTSADKDRLNLAKTLGADVIINSDEQDSVEMVRDITGGRGADVVYDVAGDPAVVPQAMLMLAKRGRISVVGLPPTGSEVPMTKLALSETSIIGSRAYELKTFHQAVKMINNGLNVEPIATHEFPLADFETAFEIVHERQGIRVLLAP